MAGKAPAQDASSSQWGKMTGRYVKQFMVGRGVLGRVFKAVDIGEAAGLGSAGRWVKRSGRSLRGPSAFADKGIDVAIKVIDLEDVEDTLDMVAREVEALTRVRCVWAGGGGGWHAGEVRAGMARRRVHALFAGPPRSSTTMVPTCRPGHRSSTW